MKSRTEYSIMNILASFIGYSLNIVLSFVCRIIFARFLAQEYLGINGLFSNIISMLSLSELGIGTAITYALYKPVAEGDRDKIAILMRFYGRAYKIIGIVISVIGIALLPCLKFLIGDLPNVAEDLNIIYLLYLFSTASSYFFSYRSSLITAYQRNYIVVSIGYLIVVIQKLLQLFVLIATRNFMLYLCVEIICVYVTNLTIAWKAEKDYPFAFVKTIKRLEYKEIKDLVINIKALTVVKLSGVLVNNTDNIVITYFDGIVTTGMASNYLLLSNMLNSLLGQLFGSITASVGNLNAIESDEKKRDFFSVLNLANFWIYGWAAVGISVLSGDIVRLCFGSKYVLDWKIPIVIALNFYIVGMQNAVWMYKNTLGLFRYGQYLLLVTAVLNICGDIYLGKKYGILGIFLATIIARLLTNVWYDPFAVFKYGLHEKPTKYSLKYVQYVAILLWAILLCKWFYSNVNFFLPLQVLLGILICTVIPNIMFLLIFYRAKEFRYLYSTFMKKIAKRGKEE